ncbi:hypothetical protein H4S02_000990 [Coemansia sp. RSA 2611]|nr:hypothetical protein H4S01_001785 [Coemansia sp. RSA 2610]KAJ2392058.1 hypothetical protein H4S02_000990 [Coemansia sp. RSA 2611]
MLGSLTDRVPLTTAALTVLALSALYALARFSPSSRIHNHCQALQAGGWWADAAALVWQPQGCTLKQYKYADVARCLQRPLGAGANGSYALFVGDSTVRNKFYAWARLIDPDLAAQSEEDGKVHADISVRWPGEPGVAAMFHWDPFLSSNTTAQVLRGAYNETLPQPRVLLMGAGTWFLRRPAESGGTVGWRRAIDTAVQRLAASRRPDARAIADHVYLSPVTHVVPDKLTPERRAVLDPEAIHWMNAYLQAADLPVLSSWSDMERTRPDATLDGLHYSRAFEDVAINVLLNRVCNRDTISPRPPFRTTCCFEYPPPVRFVTAYAALTLLLIPALLYVRARRPTLALLRVVPGADTLRQLGVFGAILLLMYVCDRTPLFEKLQKHFVGWVFAALSLASLAAGAATWQHADKTGAFLGRAQTDEWKGWMQLVILAYHLMNASGVAAIYNPVRVLVAMYLYMTGYGHCCYFYSKRDYGLRRLTAVLLRTNVLAVGLAYVMGTSYMDYYFAPLSSIWVLIVWLTMRIAPAANYTRLVWAKLAASACVFSAVNRWHLWPFALLERLGVSWSEREWEFRFGTDIFIVYVGMATALLVLQHGQQLQAHPRWPQLRRWAILAAALGLPLYFYFELTRESKFEYNKWHPYIAPVPVLSFVVLRNATEHLRSHSSSMFRSAGLISLELFIAQFHLFLAADTKAVLVLVDSRLWFVNLFFTTMVFVAMCRLLGSASGAITAWLMAPVSPEPESADVISMAELPHAPERPRALDRLAADPSLAARIVQGLARARILDNLALRWALGLALLIALNNHYY